MNDVSEHIWPNIVLKSNLVLTGYALYCNCARTIESGLPCLPDSRIVELSYVA